MAFPKSHILTSADLCEIVSNGRKTQHFCFILGSGASVESGIPSGNTLEMRWMDCLMGLSNDGDTKAKNPDRTSYFADKLLEEKKLKHPFSEIVAEWKAAKAEKRSMSSEYYFDIYLLRFHPNLREGYRYLERIMDPCKPSLGYHPLSLMLTDGNRRLLGDDENRHNLVITTNFDSLVEDSLFLYTDQRPLVISHESLAAFIDPDVKRPIVAKVHRGLMYGPFNSPDTTEDLQPEWKDALDYAFKTYTPIVVGYGGGDGSLMSALREATFRNGIYWCYREASGLPDQSIQDFVNKQKGCLVAIEGFDALMMELGIALFDQMISPDDTRSYFGKQSDRRMESYTNQWNKLKKIPHIAKILEPINKAEDKAQEERAEKGTLTYWDHFDRAYAAFESGNYDTAIKELTLAIEKDPTRPIAYYNRGLIYQNMEQPQRAIEDYSKAIELNPNYADAYTNRGNSYFSLGNHEQAIKDYTKAIEVDPNDALTYYNRGSTYDDMGQYEQAVQDFTKAIELDPNYTDAYNNRGIAYDHLGQHEQAIQDFTKAIELDPNNADAYTNRGNSSGSLDNHEQAIQDFTKAIELDPNHTNAYYNRGNTYHDLGQYEQAIQDYANAIELDPNDADAYTNRGNSYGRLGNHEQAIQDYIKAIELNPNYTSAYNNRGISHGRLGNHERAIQDLTKAIELDPNCATAYINRGNTFDNMGRHEQAIQDYSKAIELDPNHTNAYIIRGDTYNALRQHEQAIQDFTKAIELDSKYALAYYNRGNAFDDLGQYEQAILDYSKAIELDPNYAGAYNNRGNAFDDLGQYEQAILDYSKAIELDPDDADAYNCRAFTYAHKMEFGKAEADIEKALSLSPDEPNSLHTYGFIYLQQKDYHKAIEYFSKALSFDDKLKDAYEDRAKAYRALGEAAPAEADEAKLADLKAK